MTAPALRSRAIAIASSGAVKSANSREPCVMRQPSTQMLSLTTIGTPASGSTSPASTRLSTASASAKDWSGSVVTTALRSTAAAMRASACSAISLAVACRDVTALAISLARMQSLHQQHCRAYGRHDCQRDEAAAKADTRRQQRYDHRRQHKAKNRSGPHRAGRLCHALRLGEIGALGDEHPVPAARGQPEQESEQDEDRPAQQWAPYAQQERAD